MNNTYLASKPRYEVLDGLRGVAALLVILYHTFEMRSSGPAEQIINHGYLAVDFFFILSGFVIGYAYDDRWDRMSTWGFFKRRLVRLHPMVVFGTLFGACMFFFTGNETFSLVDQCPGWKFFLCLLMGLLMIPCGTRLDIRGWSETNSFNGPNWSLTFEYIGNILYAFIFRRLPKAALALLCAACAFLTLDLCLGWNVFGIFPDGPQYSVIGGWSLESTQLYIGFTRLLFPFVCGLLISRILPSLRSEDNPSGSPVRIKGGFWWASLLLIIIFCIPCIGGEMGFANGLYQGISIILLFPLIILIGAGSSTTDPFSTKLCKFFGDISYPIYITHFPLMYLQMSWVWNHPDAPLWMDTAVAIGVVVMSAGLAWAALKLYDLPVRGWLTEHWLKRKKA